MDVELTDPAANPGQMASLASLTAAVGGQPLAAEQLPDLIKQIAQNPPESKIVYESKWQLADTLFDAWGYFLCLVGLLSLEWFLRKKWGMV